jgi:hypothetical protein
MTGGLGGGKARRLAGKNTGHFCVADHEILNTFDVTFPWDYFQCWTP